MRGYTSKRRNLCGAQIALRPTLSNAAKAKADIKAMENRIAAARAKGDAAAVEKLEHEHAWLVANSLA